MFHILYEIILAQKKKKQREFLKHRKSKKWQNLNETFTRKCETAKSNYYTNNVSDLKLSSPDQWYSKLKRMS